MNQSLKRIQNEKNIKVICNRRFFETIEKIV